MGVSNVAVGARYTPNGVTTSFAIPFAYISGSPTTIKVYEIDTDTGTKTLKVAAADYNLSPDDTDPTAAIYIIAPEATVGKISIERELPITQLLDYINTGRFVAQSHETAMDKIVMLLQQLDARLNRVPEGSILDLDAGASFALPRLSANVSSYLKVNAAGTAFEFVSGSDLVPAGTSLDDISPMTTNGDLITRVAGIPARLAVGSAGQVLGVSSSLPAWVSPLIFAKYRRGTAQSIPNNTITIIDYATVDSYASSLVTTGATWKFTATTARTYSVKVAANLTSGGGWIAAEGAALMVYKNGALEDILCEWVAEATHTNSVNLRGSTDIDLVATDYIDIRIYQNSGAAINLSADPTMNFVSIKSEV
jgi:hypothetical protein